MVNFSLKMLGVGYLMTIIGFLISSIPSLKLFRKIIKEAEG
jgi:hypothetical protein